MSERKKASKSSNVMNVIQELRKPASKVAILTVLTGIYLIQLSVLLI